MSDRVAKESHLPDKQNSLEEVNGLRHAFTERLMERLAEVAEIKAEVRVGMRALDEKLDRSLASVHEKLDRVLALESKVEEHGRAITRLKTWWSALAAGIALGASFLKDWLFHPK
jgi:hypothetical protein